MDPVKWVEVTLKVRVPISEIDTDDINSMVRDASYLASHDDAATYVSHEIYIQDMDTGKIIARESVIWVYVNDEDMPSLVYDRGELEAMKDDVAVAKHIAKDCWMGRDEIWNVRVEDEMGDRIDGLSDLVRSECGL